MRRKESASDMLWYVIQTYTGREEKLTEMIRRIVPAKLYGECFVTYHEQLRSRKQENQVHVERIFPGYAFITSDDPEKLFLYLKNVPAMSKMMSVGEFCFTPLESGEAEFLEKILDANHVVRLSYVATDGRNHVSYISGPLSVCSGRIQSYQFRKRYAAVRLRIAGQSKDVRLGIILNDDIRRELTYGKVEAPVRVPEKYTAQIARMTTTAGRMASDQGAEAGKAKIAKRTEAGRGTDSVGQTVVSRKAEKAKRTEASRKAEIVEQAVVGCKSETAKRMETVRKAEIAEQTIVGCKSDAAKRIEASREADSVRQTVVSYKSASCKSETGRETEAVGTGSAGEKVPGHAMMFHSGDMVIVIDGVFEGIPAVIYRAKKNTVTIGVRLFGQDMTAEVPAECVRKIV